MPSSIYAPSAVENVDADQKISHLRSMIYQALVQRLVGVSPGCSASAARAHVTRTLFLLFLAGIGFTMSTFIATLGFDGQLDYLHNAKTSILVASVLSAIFGVLYLWRITSEKYNKSIDYPH